MAYTKKKWLDHIVDQNGAIIQQGTPVSAGNLNNLEVGTWNANQEADNASAAIREAIPSGLTKLSVIDYTYMSSNPNKIKLTGGGVAFVNGWKIPILDGTLIDVGVPPTSGDREDLVFLEVWKDQVTDTAGEKINNRIRVVQGVDFVTYAEGINNTAIVKAWGGNTTDTTYTFTKQTDDVGLYKAGSGTSTVTALKTADGYVYAIPLFRIRRRNSSSFSVVNPNGSNVYKGGIRLNATYVGTYYVGAEITLDLVNGDSSNMNVGDIFATGTSILGIITQIISTTQIKLKYAYTSSNPWVATAGQSLASNAFILSKRPDALYVDIIADRDILDLRHQVSLTGFNYQALLEENFDKLLRGGLQTKEKTKMLKTYHGLPKTPIDANTVFYASLDGTTIAELGGNPSLTGVSSYKPSITGLGATFTNKSEYSVNIALTGAVTIDLIMNVDAMKSAGNTQRIFYLIGVISCYYGSDKKFYITSASGGAFVSLLDADINGFCHMRCEITGTNMNIYINGKLNKTVTNANISANTLLSTIHFGSYGSDSTSGNAFKGVLCDVSISNIARGATFATLPADFIAGYARIEKAFNGQRKTHSDALSSQYTIGVAKGAGSGHSKGFTVTQATPGTWGSGDTIKVKGLASEIISGVIDSDTALARVVNADGTKVLTVDDTSKLVVGDTVMLVSAAGTTYTDTIAAIDTANKTITLTTNTFNSSWIGFFITETTASTSSPAVKFMNAGTLTTVTGTWTGLGTNEATFTLGTNAALVNADIQVEYSLNIPAGQGGVPEVYTEILAGEYKGKKLIPGSLAIRDDLAGKVKADAFPMSVKYIKNTVLQNPDAFTQEVETADYTNMAVTGDTLTYSVSTAVNGEVAQALLLVDMVKEVEARYGSIPAVDKVGWVKGNVGKIILAAYVSGSGPSGNKANLVVWKSSTSSYSTTIMSNTASIPSLLVYTVATSDVTIDANGFAYYLAYTDASNGTIPSSITIDSISIDIELVKPSGYDMLVPENPRRDDGLAGVLIVRKETKEIQTYFNATNTDGLITYGDYVPYQGDFAKLVSANKYVIGGPGVDANYMYPILGNRTDLLSVTTKYPNAEVPSLLNVAQLPYGYEYIEGDNSLYSDKKCYYIKGYKPRYINNTKGTVFLDPIIAYYATTYKVTRGVSACQSGPGELITLNDAGINSKASKLICNAVLINVNNNLCLAVNVVSLKSSNDFNWQNALNIHFTDVFRIANKPLIK